MPTGRDVEVPGDGRQIQSSGDATPLRNTLGALVQRVIRVFAGALDHGLGLERPAPPSIGGLHLLARVAAGLLVVLGAITVAAVLGLDVFVCTYMIFVRRRVPDLLLD